MPIVSCMPLSSATVALLSRFWAVLFEDEFVVEELCFPFAGSQFSCLWGSTAQPAACAAPLSVSFLWHNIARREFS